MSTCPRADAQGPYGPCVFNHLLCSEAQLDEAQRESGRLRGASFRLLRKEKEKNLFASSWMLRRSGYYNL